MNLIKSLLIIKNLIKILFSDFDVVFFSENKDISQFLKT